MALTIMDKEIQTLFSADEINQRTEEVAAQINADYKGVSELIVIGVLKGSLLFTSDLIRKLNLPVQLEFIRLASYGSGTSSSGIVKAYDLSLPDLTDKDILIVEDIVDSGRTAQFLLNFMKDQYKAKSIKIASLLDKPCRRAEEFKDIKPDYCCFTVEDKFIVGYGLDYDQRYRELPYLGFIEV